jgi:hypothetical protein
LGNPPDFFPEFKILLGARFRSLSHGWFSCPSKQSSNPQSVEKQTHENSEKIVQALDTPDFGRFLAGEVPASGSHP